ncbi:MAG: tyrosine-type recombinase/integrase [Acidimicrobiales bacterium]
MATLKAGYGTGSMRRRRQDVWTLRVRVDGRQHQLDFHGTEAAARRELRKLPERIRAEVTKRSDDQKTFDELLDEWLALLQVQGRAPKTIHEHRRTVEKVIRPVLGDTLLSDLTERDLDHLYAMLKADGLSDSTIRRYHMVVQAALSQAVKWHYVTENVARNASPPAQASARQVQERYRVPELAELQRIYDMAEPGMKVTVGLAAASGMRRGELCGLQWRDVNLDTGVITVVRSVWQAGATWGVKGTKTDRERTVLIGRYGVDELKKWLAWCEKGKPVPGHFVLSNGAEPVSPNHITERWAALSHRAGVIGVRFQDLRGDYVTQLIARGIDPRTAAQLVGHANPTMTLGRYARSLPPAAADAARVNDRRLMQKSRKNLAPA